MKRDPALIPISREHHKMLLLAQVLKQDAPDYKGMPKTTEERIVYADELWESLIKEHLHLEEEVLFPTVSQMASSLQRMVDELIAEHVQIRDYFSQLSLSDELALDKLGRLIEGHIRKEERQFFQQVQKVLTPMELGKLKSLLSKD